MTGVTGALRAPFRASLGGTAYRRRGPGASHVRAPGVDGAVRGAGRHVVGSPSEAETPGRRLPRPTRCGTSRRGISRSTVAAAQRYGLDWAVLAAIGKVECDHGRDPDPSCTQPGHRQRRRCRRADAVPRRDLGHLRSRWRRRRDARVAGTPPTRSTAQPTICGHRVRPRNLRAAHLRLQPCRLVRRQRCFASPPATGRPAARMPAVPLAEDGSLCLAASRLRDRRPWGRRSNGPSSPQ